MNITTMEELTLRLSLEKVDFRQPTQVTDDTSILTLKNLVFEPLLKWQPAGLAGPGLFGSWEHSPDGRIWRFHIRKAAVFHDGVACIASHITDFISAILDSTDTFGMKWSYHRYLANTKLIAENESTLKVESPTPIADILDIFTEFYICRIAADGRPILGTGRYRVAEFEKEKGRAVLEYANPADRDDQTPQRIVATAEPSAERRVSELKDGIVDAALNLERVEGKLLFEPGFQWGRAANTLSSIFYLNCKQGIFTSPKARLAVNHAVDTEALVRDVFHGLAIPSTTVVSQFHLGARDEATPIPYNVSEARRLLEGVDTSKPVVIRTPTFMPDRAEAMARFVASSLEAIGLKVVMEVETDRAAYARQVGLEKRIGDMALFDSSPHSTFRVLNDKVDSTTQAVWWQGYQDAETDRLIQLANEAVEDEDRQVAYSLALDRLREDPPWIYLVHPVEVFGARLDLAGVSLNCKGSLDIA